MSIKAERNKSWFQCCLNTSKLEVVQYLLEKVLKGILFNTIESLILPTITIIYIFRDFTAPHYWYTNLMRSIKKRNGENYLWTPLGGFLNNW